MNLVVRLAAFVAVASLMSCGGDGITAAKCDRCHEMRVLTDHPEYRPGSKIAFTLTNRTADVLRYDWCSVELVSRPSADVNFRARYLPSRRCGIDAGTAQVIEHMILLAPGASVRDSVSISGAANQSQYRLNVWLVDETGVADASPVASNTFDVYPSANQY